MKAILLSVFAVYILFSQKNLNLQGAWKLKQFTFKYPDKSYKSDTVYGGLLLVTQTHYSFAWVPDFKARIPFKILAKPDTNEMIHGFKSIVFNAGSYVIQDSILINTAQIAKVPGFETGQQFFKIHKTNSNLELIFYDEIYPDKTRPTWYGKMEIVFIFEKMDRLETEY